MIRTCDPAHCDQCVCIDDGNFICRKDEEPVIVIDNYEPTEWYMLCEREEYERVM